MKQSHGLVARYTTRITQKKKWPTRYHFFFFRRFRVKEASHSENVFAKKRYTPIYRSTHLYSNSVFGRGMCID